MSALTVPRLALLSFTAGASLAAGIMAAVAIRAAYTISTGHRWYQLKHL